MIPESHILAEPAARNTAPCIAWACWEIKKVDSKANIVVTPSDAVVMNPQEFQRVIANALAFTAYQDNTPQQNHRIVTIGIKPSRPETGSGYVETSDAVDGGIYRVKEFKEKPDLPTAQRYLEKGNYLWNAGIFVWNADTITQCLEDYKPNIAADMDKIVETGDVEHIFPQCEKISIDFAVMEPASKDGKVFTHPADFGWSDLGNWSAVRLHSSLDEHGNSTVGTDVRLFGCSDCMVHYEGSGTLLAEGLDGYLIASKSGDLLICRLSEEQRIKDFLASRP